MANMISALSGTRAVGRFGASGAAGVTIRDIDHFHMVQFSAWADALGETGLAIAKAAQCQTAPAPGRSAQGENGVVLRVEPLKWWLVSRGGSELDLPDLPVDHGVVLDMRNSRAWLHVSGAKSRTLLNHYLPLDFGDAAFPIGSVATTAFHHVGVTVWRDADGFNMLIPRSSAVSLWELLHESALQYGLIEA